MIKTVLAAVTLALVCATPAAKACVPTGDLMRPCAYQPDFLAGVRSINIRMRRERPARHSAIRRLPKGQQTASEVIGGRPAGCPHAYCGCGASLYLFGRIIPALNLAANWLKFPRTDPAPKMAAARSHHVMILERQISGNIWLVHDSNSGGGLTRLHARSIAGYIIVDPHGRV